MRVGEAKAAARRWVETEGCKTPGFAGAFFHGSGVGLDDGAELPIGSDLDIVIVLRAAVPTVKLGKIERDGVVLDVTELPEAELASAERVLGSYVLAGSFRAPSVIADPTGRLSALQAEVARRFAEHVWVVRRCAQARDRIVQHLAGIDPTTSLQDRVTSWLFGTGVMTHVLLVAGLENPTVRTRYAAAKRLLVAYGRPEVQEALLRHLGSAGLTPERAHSHLDRLAAAYDAAASSGTTPFFFSTDISLAARSIAIDGTRNMIDAGLHREAAFWLAATSARCLKILAHDAPDLYQRHRPGFDDLLADLGIASSNDLLQRADAVRAALPWLWDTAMAILHENPAVRNSEGP